MASVTGAGSHSCRNPSASSPSASPCPIAPSLAAVHTPALKFIPLDKITWVPIEPGGALAAALRL